MQLPTHYLITPAPENEKEFLASLERTLRAGTRLMQFKGKGMEPGAYAALAKKVIELAHQYSCKVLLDGDPALVDKLGADGLHLDSKSLRSTVSRPISDSYLLVISGHTREELRKGEAIGVDFAVLSPVKYTKAHPDREPLGWGGLEKMTAEFKMPIYALGGVGADDEDVAVKAGAKGVAGHRGYWKL